MSEKTYKLYKMNSLVVEIRREMHKDLGANKINCYLLNIVDVSEMIIEMVIHDFIYYDYYNENDTVDIVDLFLEKIKRKLSKTKYFNDAKILEAKFINYRGMGKIWMDVWGINRDLIVRGNLYIKLKLCEDSSNKIKLMLIKI